MSDLLPPPNNQRHLKPPLNPDSEPAQGRSQVPVSLRANPVAFRKGSSALGATVALVNAMMFSTSAEAQSTTAPAVEMPEVIVRGRQDSVKVESAESPKYTEAIRDTPQTITIVPQAVIQAQNATNLRDVLRNVPGISIQAGEGGVPAGDNLSIRGFNARTDIFIDGVRDLGGYARDSFNFEHVEVIKGPASAYSGRGSTGGSINIVTKTPKQEAFYRGDAGIGTDNYKRFTLDLNQPITALWPKVPVNGDLSGKQIAPVAVEPTVGFRLNAMWTEADVASRNEIGGRRWGIAPSLAFGLGTPTNITFTYMHLDQDNVPDYGIPWIPAANVPLARYADQAAPVDYSNFYGILGRDYEKTVTDVGTFEVKHALSEASSIRYLLRYAQSKRDSLITAPRFVNDASNEINRELQSRDQEDTILANVVDFTTRFDTFGAEHAMVAGVEYDRETQENFLRAGPLPLFANLYHPNPHVAYEGSVRRTGAVNDAQSETLSLYAFDTMKLGKHWLLTGGLRYDYYSIDFDQKDVDGVTTSLDRIDKMLSWRTALAYKPVESGTIYAAYGTSFNPSAEGLTSGFSATNAELEPEESRTFEVGTKWEFLDSRLAVNAAAFRTEKTNARTAGVIRGEANVLTGEQVVQGLEFGVTGNITSAWAVFGGYTFLDSEIKSSKTEAEIGKQLPNSPQHSFSLWTTYRLPWNIEVGAGAQYIDSRFANAINTREAPGYWNFDAMVRYEVTENISVQFNVYNLADEKYIDRIGGGHFVPGAGRSATATVSFKF
jgi:catecholate siderophore receptor